MRFRMGKAVFAALCVMFFAGIFTAIFAGIETEAAETYKLKKKSFTVCVGDEITPVVLDPSGAELEYWG